MKLYPIAIVAFAALSNIAFNASAQTADFNARHSQCLDMVSENAETAYENALQWKSDGGGFRAEHCIAMALFGLDRTNLAAKRLELLADNDYLDDALRADFYIQSANFWLLDEQDHRAYKLTNRALKLYPENNDLRIARARSYAAAGRFKFAETDLSTVIKLDPTRADAYRYRADAKLRQGQLNAAYADIEQSLELDFESVETALLRGQIREAIRLERLGKN